MANMHGFFRESAGPGWALVGDAGHFKDPSPGQGISDALRQAETLSAAVAAGLAEDDSALDGRLRDWWRRRDEDAWEMYWFAHDVGAAGPTPPLLRAVQRRVAADPALIERVVRVFNRDLAPSAAFSPRFALATLAHELRHGPAGSRRALLRDAVETGRAEARRALWRTRLGRA
jgi:2-polyprenyl-6-methoxyphenol hydroxylase-like FAD-dependent oxidoreductase